MKWIKFLRHLALALPLLAISTVSLYAQVPFYQGKTITIIVSSDAGGTSDLRVKSLLPLLQKYIPGNRPSWSNTCPAAGDEKPPIMFSGRPGLTG